jgi:hypothetical protein
MPHKLTRRKTLPLHLAYIGMSLNVALRCRQRLLAADYVSEPSLGSVGEDDQQRWAAGDRRDIELDDAEAGIADQDGLDEQVPSAIGNARDGLVADPEPTQKRPAVSLAARHSHYQVGSLDATAAGFLRWNAITETAKRT